MLDERLLLVRAHAGEHGAAHSHAVRHLGKVATHDSEALAVDGEVVALLHVQRDFLQGAAARALVPPVIKEMQYNTMLFTSTEQIGNSECNLDPSIVEA